MTPRPDPHGRRAIIRTRFPATANERIALYHRARHFIGRTAKLLPSPYTVTDELRPIRIRDVVIHDGHTSEAYNDPEVLREEGYVVVILAHTLDTSRRQYLKLNAHAVLLPGDAIDVKSI